MRRKNLYTGYGTWSGKEGIEGYVLYGYKTGSYNCRTREGMYGEPEMVSKAKENRHMMFTEAAQLAKEAEVSELWLTHYSPSLIRPDDFMEPVRKIFPAAKPGKDRKSAYLTFEKKENE